MSTYDSNASRREFLKILGLLGVGVSLGGTQSCVNSSSKDSLKTLRFFGTGTLDIGEYWQKLKEELNIELLFEDNGNDTGPVITSMVNGTASVDYDLGGLQGGAERELAEAGKIIPWDLSKISNWESMWDWAKDIPYTKIGNKQYGLPIVINADSIIYLPEFTGGEIDSYAAVFDPKFKGRASMEDAWINSAIFAAIYLKESGLQKIDNPGDLTEDELEGVMEFLIKKKKEGQFKTFWRGWEQGLNLIKSKEVYVMTGWEPIVYAAQKAGINAKYAVPKEGYEGWSNDLILHAGAKNRSLIEEAHKFANWELSGFYGAVLAKERGYIVPNGKAYEYALNHPKEFNAEDQEKKSENVENKFKKMKGKVYWQNVRPKNFKLYEDWWSKLRNS